MILCHCKDVPLISNEIKVNLIWLLPFLSQTLCILDTFASPVHNEHMCTYVHTAKALPVRHHPYIFYTATVLSVSDVPKSILRHL